MAGKIKAGEGTLIGNAGEHYVVAELLKRGVTAALAPRNSPAFDILATFKGQTICIRVKTKSEQYDIWQWNVKSDGMIFRDLRDEGDFTILVNLTEKTEDLQFFILPTNQLDRWLKSDFQKWVSTPGSRGQQRNPGNKKRHLPYSKYKSQLKMDWDALWN